MRNERHALEPMGEPASGAVVEVAGAIRLLASVPGANASTRQLLAWASQLEAADSAMKAKIKDLEQELDDATKCSGCGEEIGGVCRDCM